jgi:hypothetical protein
MAKKTTEGTHKAALLKVLKDCEDAIDFHRLEQQTVAETIAAMVKQNRRRSLLSKTTAREERCDGALAAVG